MDIRYGACAVILVGLAGAAGYGVAKHYEQPQGIVLTDEQKEQYSDGGGCAMVTRRKMLEMMTDAYKVGIQEGQATCQLVGEDA